VTMAMGEDHALLRFLGRKTKKGVPVNALLLQLFIVNVLLLSGSFDEVVVYIQFSLLLCSLLTVLGVIVWRWKRPDAPRPYRVWAYPLPPLIFAAITIWMMVYLLRHQPIESLSGLATMLAGLALYFFAGKERALSA
jgi:basic amino acid/polyamine antiporter, APA family